MRPTRCEDGRPVTGWTPARQNSGEQVQGGWKPNRRLWCTKRSLSTLDKRHAQLVEQWVTLTLCYTLYTSATLYYCRDSSGYDKLQPSASEKHMIARVCRSRS
ncbi:hypothetical protein BV20DRAFT_696652 [Pilatotrama ljubarskyi]|nr:hypothetical protein BV20DRAFT_696652 [Pilatotrama ljubarskyi]